MIKKTLPLILLIASTLGVFAANEVTIAGSTGVNGTYNTLKAAFDAINAGGSQSGNNITIAISADITETSIANLTNKSWTTLKIYPTAASVTISGSLNSELISLTTCSNVTIDGQQNQAGAARNLTITNTSTGNAASTLLLKTNSTNNTVKYCVIKGSSLDGTGGVVYLSTATATNGNTANTFSNNKFTCAADANRPKTVFYSGGSSGFPNTANTISNNEFCDFFNPSNDSRGIWINTYNDAFTITGNSFYETTAFAPTESSNLTYKIMQFSSGTGHTISNNYIGGSAASCGGRWNKTAGTNVSYTNSFIGIVLNLPTGTPATSIQNNTIQNITWTSTLGGAFTGISATTGEANIGTTTGNSIGDNTTTGSIILTNGTTTQHIGISIGSASTVTCQNNKIGSIELISSGASNQACKFKAIEISGSGNATVSSNTIGGSIANSINSSTVASTTNVLYGISCTDGTGTNTISSNDISNLTMASTATSSDLFGIMCTTTTGTNTISNNTIHDFISASNNNANSALFAGIVIGAVNVSKTVSGNRIYNLVGSADNGIIAGISCLGAASSTTVTNTISGNFIYNLTTSSTSASAEICGIYFSQNMHSFYNNIIYLGNTMNSLTKIYGFKCNTSASFDATQTNSFYYNTVYITGAPTSGTSTSNSYCFYNTKTNISRILKNNIFYNVRTVSGATSYHYAIYETVTGLTSDNNDYYSAGDATYNVLASAAGTDKTTIALWRTYTGSDAASVNVNPTFASAGGTTATNYVASNTLLVGASGTGITTDYAGTTRTDPAMGVYNVVFVPHAPTAAVATAGDTKASIAFTIPDYNGGSAILDYTATSTPGSFTGTGSASGIIVTGLTNGVSYTFTVRARNAIGNSAESSASGAITPSTSLTISTSQNISAVPYAATSDLTIATGATLTINQNASINSITVNAGGKLDLASNTLTSANVVLKASKTAEPLVSVTTAMVVSGSLTYKKTLDNTIWYFMSLYVGHVHRLAG